jgi:hypothetical protein
MGAFTPLPASYVLFQSALQKSMDLSGGCNILAGEISGPNTDSFLVYGFLKEIICKTKA